MIDRRLDAERGGAGYTVLPGLSQILTAVRGNVIMCLAIVSLVGLAWESDLGSAEAVYAGSLFGLIVGLAIAGVVVVRSETRKERLEIENGYTTSTPIAITHPELYLLTYKTFHVVSAPGELRPPDRPPFRSLRRAGLHPDVGPRSGLRPSAPGQGVADDEPVIGPRRCVKAGCAEYS